MESTNDGPTAGKDEQTRAKGRLQTQAAADKKEAGNHMATCPFTLRSLTPRPLTLRGKPRRYTTKLSAVPYG